MALQTIKILIIIQDMFRKFILLLHTLKYVDLAYVIALYYSITSEILRAEFYEC